MSWTSGVAGAVHASAALAACVAAAEVVGALVAVTVDDASGVAVGAAAVLPAHPAIDRENVRRESHRANNGRGLQDFGVRFAKA